MNQLIFAQTIVCDADDDDEHTVESVTSAHIRFDYLVAIRFVKVVRNNCANAHLHGYVERAARNVVVLHVAHC